MTFDASTHKFGMAYLFRSIPEPTILYNPESWGQPYQDMFIRAPKHDLIPAAVADKMRDALERLVIIAEVNDWSDKEAIVQGDKALTEYAAARGEK